MPNLILEQPPNNVPINNPMTKTLNLGWSQWFDRLHFLFSTSRNNQIINAATVIDPDAQNVQLNTTTATYAVTLAAPTVANAVKVIEFTSRTGSFNVTLALTNIVGGTAATTCTFNTQGGTLHLQSSSVKWVVIKQYNVTLT